MKRDRKEASVLNLNDLEQFVAFSEQKTLARVAESFHISTPSVTRAMQRLEESFGVPLFSRGKNKIELNETGTFAAEYAKKLLQDADQAITQVRAFDACRKTIIVKSCAPAPLWKLLHKLNAKHPNMMISSAICQNDDVLTALANGSCDIGILPFSIDDLLSENRSLENFSSKILENNMRYVEFMHEHLFVCVPSNHELAQHDTLTFSQINGFNFLLRTELGFWDTLCREKMPASKFLVQTDVDAFEELVKASSLPCFSTDYRRQLYADWGQMPLTHYDGRINIPLIDSEANVTFYLVSVDRGNGSFVVPGG